MFSSFDPDQAEESSPMETSLLDLSPVPMSPDVLYSWGQTATSTAVTYYTSAAEPELDIANPDTHYACADCHDVTITGFADIPMPQLADGPQHDIAVILALTRAFYLKREGITAAFAPAFIAAHLTPDGMFVDALQVLRDRGIALASDATMHPDQIDPAALHPVIRQEAKIFRVRDFTHLDSSIDVVQILEAGDPLLAYASHVADIFAIYAINAQGIVTGRTATDATIRVPLDDVTDIWTILL